MRAAQPVRPPRDGWIVGWVLDGAPVAGAEVRLAAVPPAACPCGDGNRYSLWDMPYCTCPAALVQWKERLAACAWPPPPLAVGHSDERGRVAVPRVEGATLLQVSTATRMAWLPVPPRESLDVAMDLEPAFQPHVTIVLADGRPAADVPGVRGAFLFEDGPCVPLVADGATWIPATPIPDREAVVVVDVPDQTPAVRPWRAGNAWSPMLVVRPLETITGQCRRDDPDHGQGTAFAGRTVVYNGTIRYEGAFDRFTTQTDRSGHFMLHGVPALNATLSCEHRGKVVARWTYFPDDDWLEPDILEEPEPDPAPDDDPAWRPGDDGARSFAVEVVDDHDRPLSGAEVSFWQGAVDPRRLGFATGSWKTSERGRVCAHELLEGGYLVVSAPDRLGGWCSAYERMPHRSWDPGSYQPPRLRVALTLRSVPRATARGRVLSSGGYPVAGAEVRLYKVSVPTPDGDCDAPGASTTTAADGTFVLADVPRGRGTLEVERHYRRREIEIDVPGPPLRVVLDLVPPPTSAGPR